MFNLHQDRTEAMLSAVVERVRAETQDARAEHVVAPWLVHTNSALRLLVDGDEPLWGVALSALDADVAAEFAMMREQPAHDMVHEGEACAPVAEWIDFLVWQHREIRQPGCYTRWREDRAFLAQCKQSRYCNDFERLAHLLNEDMLKHDLTLELQQKSDGSLSVSLLDASGKQNKGLLWRSWRQEIEKIVIAPSQPVLA